MLRGNFLKFNSINSLDISQNIFGIQSVRWRRKPRWLPTAPSKMFRVPERKVLPQNENNEWLRLNNNYRTQVNSLRRYLIQEVAEKKKQSHLLDTPADEEAEFQRCLQLNDQWNQEISKNRVQRVEADNEARREQILLNIENRKIREAALLKEIEEKVKMEEIESKSYITRENIDKVIEQALANPVDFNFAIDLQGKKSNEIVKENENSQVQQ